MSFTLEQKKRIDYFRRSVRLDDVTTANDPAYKFSDEDLWGILEFSAPVHRGNSIDNTPNEEYYFVLLLAKREIYYRLATTTAPFYPLSAEGASLEKNVRFDHYIKLVETVTEEYDNMYEKVYGNSGDDDPTGTGGVLTTYNTKLYGKPYLRRYDILSDDIFVELHASGITETSVNLDWTRFDTIGGSDFLEYRIYASEEMIYDEYSPLGDSIKIKPLYIIENVRKTKIRVTDLEPGKEYFLLVEVKSTRGQKGLSQITIATKPVNPPKVDEELKIGGDE